jgi:hypothetical protein
MKTAGLSACRESDAAASPGNKVEPNSTLRPMLDNVAEQTIIGWWTAGSVWCVIQFL